VILILAAAACLAVSVATGILARADITRKPTAAQRAAAAATAVADRWRTMAAGQIFPATLSYSTALLTTETASRTGIAPGSRCASALAASVAQLAGRDRCQAGLRATYLDQLQGVLYTVGVLAFPSAHLASSFAAGLPASVSDLIALRPLALPGTGSALFSPDARQAGTVRQRGPYVVLTVAGYADGEPAGSGQQARPSDFAPAAQLASAILGPLTRPVSVSCQRPEWSC
jgi:hypothetical protein